jgi:hypothetical protein
MSDEIGRLLLILTARSEGGYVLVRLGWNKRKGHAEWRVSTRGQGQDFVNHGVNLGDALYRAACRWLEVIP